MIVEGDDRYGDGVNIAARLQRLAEPGGIAVSRTVVDHVKHKLPMCFKSLGEQQVKNITEPVGVYRLAAEGPARRLPFSARLMRLSTPRVRLAAAAILLLVAGAGATAWYLDTRDHQPFHRLSIVVLPFTNLGTDPEQDYFADAITNDLTTDLSRIEDSFVIAANTARTYKGRKLDAKQIGRELNVRYILDGSLRRTENRVRINAQLIDTKTEAAIWSDRFDADWTMSMQLQDDITGRLARNSISRSPTRKAVAPNRSAPTIPTPSISRCVPGWCSISRIPPNSWPGHATYLNKLCASSRSFPKRWSGWR